LASGSQASVFLELADQGDHDAGLDRDGPARLLAGHGGRAEACADHGVESVMLKRLGSPYLPGRRSPDWRKLKVPTWAAEYLPRRSSGDLQLGPAGSAAGGAAR
jgi:hypothetical protein